MKSREQINHSISMRTANQDINLLHIRIGKLYVIQFFIKPIGQ
jgi:hypothetical protein